MKNFRCILLVACALHLSLVFIGQGVLIGNAGDNPDPASVLEIRSTSQGLLPPRLSTSQRNAIENPPPGLRIYNTDTGCENFYSGVTERWMAICGSCAPDAPSNVTHESTFYDITWSWPPVPEADGYKWNTVNDYSSATDLGLTTTVLQYTDYPGAEAVIYLWSYNESCGESERPRRMVATSCPSLYISPASHVISSTQIQWLWGGYEASGYKINFENDYSTAVEVNFNEGYMQSYLQTDLTPETSYTIYVWGYSNQGAACISDVAVLEATTSAAGCVVGEIGPGGGIIAYCGSAYAGKIGLEISTSDNSSGTTWGCHGTDLPGAQGWQIGTGLQNTQDILAGCATAGIAARVCSNLDQGGYSDWFLPSQSELQTGWLNLNYTGGALASGAFQNVYYWTSTESSAPWNATRAMLVHMGNGGGLSGPLKSENHPVRCMRAF